MTKPELVLQFSAVSYSGKSIRSLFVTKRLQQTRILNEVCGEFKSGQLSAILGPSGSGKTSLLNVLSGFKINGTSGFIGVNGVECNSEEFRKISSYIPQDFPMLDLLTVYETIKVSADLKLPPDTSASERKEIIKNVLKILNMEKCVKTLVKNLSGGEKKRLSIATELVTNPPIMFFDEPTSGLDSVASLQLMTYLHRLATDGRIIVCVVHQPSSRLINFFDNILVMSNGEILYCGPRNDMINYFEDEGFICPKYYNPADFVLEVASREHQSGTQGLIEKNRRLLQRKGKLEEIQIAVDDENCEILKSQVKVNKTDVRPKIQKSLRLQFTVLVKRTLQAMSRNLMAVQLRILMHALVAFLLGIVFYDIGNDAAKILSNNSCIFFSVLFIFFGNAMPSILLCPQDTAVFIREYLNGWYSMAAYYLSKIIADVPLQFACPTIFISIVYVLTGQPANLDRFYMCWGVSLLTAVVGHFVGLVFGSMFEMQMAIFLVPGICIPMLIFSGFFIRIHELTPSLRPLTDVSFFRYTMEGFIQSIYGHNRTSLQCNQDFCYYKSPEKFLRDMDMFGDRYGADIIALLATVVVMNALFFLSLVLRIRKAQ